MLLALVRWSIEFIQWIQKPASRVEIQFWIESFFDLFRRR